MSNQLPHTPGKWVASGNGVHVGMRCVATTRMEPKEQRDADAVLIAAAPELLEVCKMMLLDVGDGGPGTYDYVSMYTVLRIKEAVAKAMGKESSDE